MRAVHGGFLDLSNRDQEAIRQHHSQQALLRDLTEPSISSKPILAA
jgi:hypothetical protein